MFRARDGYRRGIPEFYMEIKKTAGIITAAVFLFLSRALCAQEAGYFVDYSEGRPRFIQRLVWDSDEYALYYEILISVDNNGYREYSRDRTENNFIQVSLPPGKYRYNVTPFSLLEIRGETSEWKEFEVFQAFVPELDSFSPYAFHLDQNFERVLHITGANFLEESEFYLKSKTNSIYPQRVVITSGSEAALYFNDLELVTGDYEIYVKNPGGLDNCLGYFYIDYNKPTDFFIKLTWTPAFPIYGHIADVLGGNMFPSGVSLSFQIVSSRRGELNGGLELSASVFFLDSAIPLTKGNDDSLISVSDAYNDTFFTSLDFNFVVQRRSGRERVISSLRFGFGIIIINGFEKYKKDNDIIFEFNISYDMLIRLTNNFFLEAGADFNNYYSSGFSGIIKPRLGLALKF